eukprot:XP_001689918.1 predicted protein [Chlamydomonas reinhardtii]
MSKDASEIVDTPGWQVSLLLLLFATVTLILEKSLHFLEHAFHNKRGLRTALHHVKEEIFIFVVACTHIVYGTATIYLTLWKVHMWRKWEEDAHKQHESGDVKVMQMPAEWLYNNLGRNRVVHAVLVVLRQWTTSVNQTMYHNARLMFIEKMGLPYDFDFHELVVMSLEEELARTLHPEWHLWLGPGPVAEAAEAEEPSTRGDSGPDRTAAGGDGPGGAAVGIAMCPAPAELYVNGTDGSAGLAVAAAATIADDADAAADADDDATARAAAAVGSPSSAPCSKAATAEATADATTDATTSGHLSSQRSVHLDAGKLEALLLDLTLVPQVALGVLPLYALIQPLGSHCSRRLLKEAARAGLNPRQMGAIARQLNMRVDQAVASAGKHASHPFSLDGVGAALSRLVGLGGKLAQRARAKAMAANVAAHAADAAHTAAHAAANAVPGIEPSGPSGAIEPSGLSDNTPAAPVSSTATASASTGGPSVQGGGGDGGTGGRA